MKNLFYLIVFLFSTNFYSQSITFEKNFYETSNIMSCSDFTVEISVGFASVSTTVYVCCDASFLSPSQGVKVPCKFVSKRFYEAVVGSRIAISESKGIDLKDIFVGVDLTNVENVKVIRSSETNDKRSIALKEYKVIDGFVNFEIINR